MANPNPYQGRQAYRRQRKPGNLLALQRIVWNALLEAQAVLERAPAEDPELKLKAVHALSQCAGQYAKLIEVGELEGRMQALEARVGQDATWAQAADSAA